MYALSNRCQPWSNGEELVLLAVEFQVKNLTNETVTFKASDITSAKIDGHKAKVVLDPKKAANVSGLGDYTPLFDANGTKTYGPGKDLNKQRRVISVSSPSMPRAKPMSTKTGAAWSSPSS